jgi:hypothetical protein
MSWASAAGYCAANPPPQGVTEYDFIIRARRPHEFWDNARTHLQRIITGRRPDVVGLQEMILTPPSNIDNIIQIINADYYHRTGTINFTPPIGQPIDACVFTFWKKELGRELFYKTANLANLTDGRPISIIYTENGYLLINLHSPQDLALAVLQEKINFHLISFILEHNLPWTQTKVYVVGDFNNINIDDATPLLLLNDMVTLTTGRAVRSCCFSNGGPTSIADYERVGDYCLGHTVVTRLTIDASAQNRVGESIESDHELVVATFDDP